MTRDLLTGAIQTKFSISIAGQGVPASNGNIGVWECFGDIVDCNQASEFTFTSYRDPNRRMNAPKITEVPPGGFFILSEVDQRTSLSWSTEEKQSREPVFSVKSRNPASCSSTRAPSPRSVRRARTDTGYKRVGHCGDRIGRFSPRRRASLPRPSSPYRERHSFCFFCDICIPA